MLGVNHRSMNMVIRISNPFHLSLMSLFLCYRALILMPHPNNKSIQVVRPYMCVHFTIYTQQVTNRLHL